MGRIVSSFVQQMNGALNDQFVQLGCTMTDINQNQLATMEHVHQAIQSAGAIVTDVKQLQMVSQDVMAHFEHYVQELGDARRRDERFEQSTADLLAQLHQMTEHQTSAMNKVKAAQEALIRTMEQYTLENGKAITSMQQSAAANGRQLDHMASAMTGAGQELSASCQQFVQGVVGSLSQALGMFDANMSQLVATLTERVEGLGASGTSAATAEQTAEMQRLLTQLSHSIDNAASVLTAKEG